MKETIDFIDGDLYLLTILKVGYSYSQQVLVKFNKKNAVVGKTGFYLYNPKNNSYTKYFNNSFQIISVQEILKC